MVFESPGLNLYGDIRSGLENAVALMWSASSVQALNAQVASRKSQISNPEACPNQGIWENQHQNQQQQRDSA